MSEALTPAGRSDHGANDPPFLGIDLPPLDLRLRSIIAVLLNRLGGEATIEQHEMNGIRPARIIPQTNGDTKLSADKDFARCGS
jgi:hypothetical protein